MDKNAIYTRFDRRTCLRAMAGAAAGFLGGIGSPAGGFDRKASGVSERGIADALPVPLSLDRSLRLAGGNLLAMLDPERNYLPYFNAEVRPDLRAEMKRWWPAHNIGRWWDAVLRLEESIGFEIPPAIETAMMENVRRFFDNPDHICLDPGPAPYPQGPPREGSLWDLHSLREGLLALNALARWRKSDWAAAMGRMMIESVGAKLCDDGTWDVEKFDACRVRGKKVVHNLDPCDTHGRMLEALVWFYETTGDAEALRLAERIARFHFANTVQPNGSINPASRADHTHSYFGTLRGLLLYGRLARRREFIDRVAAAYQATVRRVVHESGYTSHNMAAESFGETTSPGDAAQIALWLSEDGRAEFLDDTERLVRARILPSQILRTPPLRPAVDDGRDPHRDIERRIIGAYGGCHAHPHGAKRSVTDVTAADIHTLVDIRRNIVRFAPGRIEVIFHLDYEDERVRIASRRKEAAELEVTPKIATAVALRVPRWAPRDSLRLLVGGALREPVFAGPFACIGKVPAGSVVAMRYGLPERRTKETDLGTEYEIAWRGDDVAGVQPNTKDFPFYPDL
jgi:hypothetical protein